MDQNFHIDDLIAKLDNGTLNEAEYDILVAWYNGFDDSKVALNSAEQDTAERLKARMRQRLFKSIHPVKAKPKRRVKIRKWLPYGAVATLAIALMYSWFLHGNKTTDLSDFLGSREAEIAEDILPANNRATLIGADGQTIDLKDEQGGIVMGDELHYADGSSVFSTKVGTREHNPVQYTLSTPRGGTYKISLSDGTEVWLNAASTLKYPSQFLGNERVVEVSGEAYFSVVPDKDRPFKVVNADQTVNVLGTEFNITAYADEMEISTTLIEGSVRVESNANRQPPIVLQPGQQANLSNGIIDLQDVNTAPYVAWKDGLFYFENTPFEVMMREIGRWYDVDVVYKDNVPKESFSGKLRRTVTLTGVLEMLRASGIEVALENNTIVVN